MKNLLLKKWILSLASLNATSGARAQRKMILLLMLFTIAFYNNGYSQECIPPTSPPSGSSVINITSSSATIQGFGSPTGTAPFTFYWRVYNAGGTQVASGSVEGSGSFTPTGLQAGTWHYGSISVSNECGTAPGYDSFGFTTLPPPCTAAGTPSSASASASGATSASLSWGGSSGTATITYFWSVKQTSGGSTASTGSTTSTSATASSLTPNTQYYLDVYANNCGGNSGTRTSSSFYTSPGTPTVNAATTTSLNVAITGNTNASTEFAIQETGGSKYVQANGSLDAAAVWQTEAVWETDAGSTAKTVTGLSVNTQYTFIVKAKNGSSTESSASAALYTLANIPSSPTVNNPAATSLDVAINDNGNPANTAYAIYDTITGKYVQAGGTLGVSIAWQTKAQWHVNASGTTKTVTGLIANTEYAFKVKARNGNSTETDFGSEVSLITLAAVPAAPVVNAADSIALNVAISANGNPDTTGFAIYERKGNKYIQADGTLGSSVVWQTEALWETDATNTAKTVTGLMPNTEYTFMVKARNGDNVETAPGAADSLFTLANVPAPPAVINPTATSLDVVVNPNGNSAATLFAIQDSALVSQYVQINGTLGRAAPAAWQTAAAWDTITVTGLSTGVTYYFRVKAKNGDNVETAFGISTGQNTCSNPTDGGSIGTNDTICYGTKPSPLTSITLPSNYGGTLEYKWQYSTDSLSFTDIEHDSIGYAPGTLNNTTWYKRLAKVDCKPNWDGAAESNVVKITVQPLFVSTQAVSAITSTTATGNGNINSICSSNATNRGVIWYLFTRTNKIIGEPGVTDVGEESGNFGTGRFTVTLTGLSVNTRYNVRAYATNLQGTDYGGRVNFWTLANVPSAPTVNNPTRNTLDVTVNANGNPDSTKFAIHETLTNSFVQADGSLGADTVWANATIWGTKTVTGLTTATEYTFEVKARNGGDTETAYGTSATGTPVTYPDVTTQAAGEITATSATGNGNVTATNGINPTERGIIYWLYNNTNQMVEDSIVTNITETGTPDFGTGAFTRSLTGLTVNTRYNARAYATNTQGTGYGGRVNFWTLANVPSAPTVNNPTRNTLDVTVNENGNPASTKFAIHETLTNSFVQTDGSLGADTVWAKATVWGTKKVTGLTTATEYTFEVKARNGENTETAYGTGATGTPVTSPDVTTQAAGEITTTSATGNGNVTATNGINPTERGIIHWLYNNTNQMVEDSIVTNVSETGTPDFGTGAFTRSLTGLTVNTRYNARAYATNTQGTGYGGRVNFWTLANVPSAPTVNNPSTTALDVAINTNGNPAVTTYAIFDTITGQYVQANGTLGATTVWRTEASWEVNAANTAKTVTGLTKNSLYTFKVKAKNGAGTETDFGGLTSLYTLSGIPGTPVVNAPDTTSLNVAINVMGNPDITGFAIYERKGNKYVQADGTLDASAVWQTEALWETDATNTAKTVTGLIPNTEYTFLVKARNGDDVETDFSEADSLFTLANVPAPPSITDTTGTSLVVAVNLNGNPESTLFAILDSAQVYPRYLQADGTRGATEIWQTAATWRTVTVSGLINGVTYYYKVKAKNGNDVETAFSLSTSQNTCFNPSNGGEIGSDQTICTGSMPDTLFNISDASNYGGTLEYQWQQASLTDSTDFADITDAEAASYAPGVLSSATWYRRLAKVKCKADWSGAAVSNVIKISIGDVTDPVPDIETLADVTAECEVDSLTAPTATDECAGTITATHDATLPITAQDTTVVTWTYDDGNGNSITQTQNVVIDDVTDPVADNVTLADITAECEVDSLTAPTATDECAGTITATHDATLPITAQDTTVVTWTYDDGNGNSITQTQNVVIDDVTDPVADNVTLADVTAECEVDSLTAPTATDECAGTITATHDATLPITAQDTTVVTWTYDDGNGNSITQTQNVVIDDVTDPVPDNAPLADVTAECEVTSLTAPTATDECAGTITATHDATLPITAQGTTVVTWTYDDGNGNSITQPQNVVIDDVTDPVADIAPLADVTAECEVNSLTAPTATDECAGTITATHDATLPITAQGTTVVTWTYDDGNGNSTTQTQNVVIKDVTNPVPDDAILADITAECEVDSLTAPTATDNCAGKITATHDATLPITAQGKTVVIWTYDDGNGITVLKKQNVLINDVTDPVADNATLADITAEVEVDSLTAPTATDNCAGTITATHDATLPITAQGKTVVTWTYDDGNGNNITQTQNVVIDDVTKPIVTAFTLPANSASLVVPVSSFTATDNKAVTGFKLTETSAAPLAGDAGWTTIAPTSYTFATEGTKTLYAWAKDEAGNVSASASAQVIITLSSATLGNTEVYGLTTTDANRRAQPVTFSEGGTIQSVSIYHNGGTGRVLLGVYSDQPGKPLTQLGKTAITVVNLAAGWQTIPLTSPVTVTSGQKVWLAWVFETNPGIRWTYGAPGRASSAETWPSGMPAAFGASSVGDYKYSIYCTYKPIATADLGNKEVYGLTTTDANRRAQPVTFSEGGTIQSVSIYHSGGTGSVLLGVYSDQPGKPLTQLGKTAITVVNLAAGWQTIPLISPVTVTSGQKVWLAWVFETNPGIRWTYGAPGRASSAETWPSGMPVAFGASSVGDYKYSIYCTYTTGVTPTLTVAPTDISLGYGSGSNGTFNITSNTTWNITDDASWLDITPTSGSNNGAITVTANSANTGTVSRTGTVTITGSGAATKTVTVTQDPQLIATADLGNKDIYGLTTTDANRRAQPVTFSEGGTIQSVSIYHNGGTGRVLLGVYSDQSGKPLTQLGKTAITVVNLAAGWQTIPLISPVTVTSGQKVWLAWVFETNPGIRWTYGAPGRASSAETWSSGMPAAFGASSVGDYKYSIYCTYIADNTKSAVIAGEIEPVFEKADLKVYPNPFSEKLRFEFVSPESVNARIDLYDMTGRIVKTIFEQPIEGGVNYEAEFRPETIISGMYIYRMTMGETVYNGKVVFKKE